MELRLTAHDERVPTLTTSTYSVCVVGSITSDDSITCIDVNYDLQEMVVTSIGSAFSLASDHLQQR